MLERWVIFWCLDLRNRVNMSFFILIFWAVIWRWKQWVTCSVRGKWALIKVGYYWQRKQMWWFFPFQSQVFFIGVLASTPLQLLHLHSYLHLEALFKLQTSHHPLCAIISSTLFFCTCHSQFFINLASGFIIFSHPVRFWLIFFSSLELFNFLI